MVLLSVPALQRKACHFSSVIWRFVTENSKSRARTYGTWYQVLTASEEGAISKRYRWTFVSDRDENLKCILVPYVFSFLASVYLKPTVWLWTVPYVAFRIFWKCSGGQERIYCRTSQAPEPRISSLRHITVTQTNCTIVAQLHRSSIPGGPTNTESPKICSLSCCSVPHQSTFEEMFRA